MLRSLKEIEGYHIEARDGTVGHVYDFYFDDEKEMIRYVVVDCGTFLPGRKVLLTLDALRKPDWESKSIPVDLSKDVIENSPDINTELPVSHQETEKLHDYFGWPMYWPVPGDHWVPLQHPPRIPDKQRNENRVAREQGDPNLRSFREITRYSIQAIDDEIGQVSDMIIDDAIWILRYIIVDTRRWLPGRQVILAYEWLEDISWMDESILINLPRKTIQNAPEYDPEKPVNRKYEERLYDFYGRPRYWNE
jgi:hypothetical protein